MKGRADFTLDSPLFFRYEEGSMLKLFLFFGRSGKIREVNLSVKIIREGFPNL